MQIINREFLVVESRTCHASTVAFHKNQLIYAWFGGTREGNPDSCIYIQIGDKVAQLGNHDNVPRWNPILFPYEDKLYLFVKIGVFCDRWQTLIYDISNLEDLFRNKPIPCQFLPAGLNGPVKTKPLVDNWGRIYCGSSVETAWTWASYIEVYNVFDGKFQIQERSLPLIIENPSGSSYPYGIIQPAIWRFNDSDYFHAFFRSSRGIGKIYYSGGYLDDDGTRMWEKPVPTIFKNPNSSVDVVTVGDRLFLVHNPATTRRSPLMLSEIKEANENELYGGFEVIDEIEIRDEIPTSEVAYSAELSYPYMIEHDGKIHITYTYGRTKIEHVEVEI